MIKWSLPRGALGTDKARRRCVNCELLLLILAGAALLRLLYVNQPFVDAASWREADDATIADSFFRGHLNIFLPEISWNGAGSNYVGYEFQLTTYLAALLYHIFGQADWVGRGISVAFGLWGIFAFYNLVLRAFDAERALVSSAVLAVTPGGIFVDRSFLPDPVMVSLVVTSFWMLLAYLQDRRIRYLSLAVLTGIFGLLTKISGIMIGIPVIYAILSLQPGRGTRVKVFGQLTAASILVIIPVAGYYIWAIHVSHAYPPYHMAASGNWIWDGWFDSWFQAHYFWPGLSSAAKLLWGAPMIAAGLTGLLSPQARHRRGILPWLFHYWLLAGLAFYAFGARELVDNPWNFHIFDPALAGLAAQGLLVAAGALARLRVPIICRTAIILIIVAIHAFEMKNLRRMYVAYDRETRELGLALGRISGTSDLVVTVGNDIGHPGAIYYSQRRGWIFPPAWPGVDWWEDIMDEPAAIQLFDRLQSEGAQWFGIVAEQRAKFRKNTPRLLAHIESATELISEDLDWAIYRIPPSRQGPDRAGGAQD